MEVLDSEPWIGTRPARAGEGIEIHFMPLRGATPFRIRGSVAHFSTRGVGVTFGDSLSPQVLLALHEIAESAPLAPEEPPRPAGSARPAAAASPDYRHILQNCRDRVTERYTKLFKHYCSQAATFITTLAEQVETSASWNHYLDIRNEIAAQQALMERAFTETLARRFNDFVGQPPVASRSTGTDGSGEKMELALVEMEEYEVVLAYANAVNRANTLYSAQLSALSRRLAIVKSGLTLGECNAAIPGCPAAACEAMKAALDVVGIPISHKLNIAMIGEFERLVLLQAHDIYDEFNDILDKAGILPSLPRAVVRNEPRNPNAGVTSQSVEQGAVSALAAGLQESVPREGERLALDNPLDQEVVPIFEAIQNYLAHRRAGVSADHNTRIQTNLPELLTSLNQFQISAPSYVDLHFAQQSLNAAREAFTEQLAKVAEILRERRVNSVDADVVDMVGMLFSFILDDKALPDSVKVLLSQLHTTYIKVALLDKEFFVHKKHPARQLLNTLAQAGAMSNANEKDEQSIFAKMGAVVEKIVQDFDSDTEIFNKLLEDFNVFLDRFNQRSRFAEKRLVGKAEGRERLRLARQAVSQEIVDRTWNRSIPKAAEELLMGPWANLLVLLYLKNGKSSAEWEDALAVVDAVLWSVVRKNTDAERKRVKEKLPDLQTEIHAGLELLGDSPGNIETLIREIEACQSEEGPESPAPPAVEEVVPGAKTDTVPLPRRPAIWDDVQVEPSWDTGRQNAEKQFDPAFIRFIEQLKKIKLGTWFEFSESEGHGKIRAKLSWYSPRTGYYIFVNQAGIQVMVKSLRALGREMKKGETRIIVPARKPLISRAMENIYSFIRGSEEQTLANPSLAVRFHERHSR